MSGDAEIEKICNQIVKENAKLVAQYKSSNKNSKNINKLMGLVRKATDGKYDMKKVNDCLLKILKE